VRPDEVLTLGGASARPALAERRREVALTDAQLVLVTGGILFALFAWPLLLVGLPPLQDLPNHLATAHIIQHPELYPEYTFNGFFKSNALLTLWFRAFGGHGLYGAARAFVALVLAANALALPLFVLHFAGRRSLWVALLVLWPLVHSFSVSMGFLNFAFAFAASLLLLVVLDRQRVQPSARGGLAVAAVAGLVWYAHPFPLAVVGVLVAAHVLRQPSWRQRVSAGVSLLLPLVPAGLMAMAAAQHHLVKAEHSSAAPANYLYLSPFMNLRHLWMDASGALTHWGSMTVVPAILLPVLAWRHRRLERPFLSNLAIVGLLGAYVALPVMLSNWYYLNCRLVPFIWIALALRLPDTLSRGTTTLLILCALSFSVVLGVDYLRLDRDRAEVTAGLPAVPRHARLLPLMFKQRKTSDYTASLTHAWGYYTVEKDTSAPLVFGVERSYPITYRDFPPRELIPPALDMFAERNATPDAICQKLSLAPGDAACAVAWREIWRGFWRQAEPRFDHVLTWAIPPGARDLIPPSYRRVLAAGQLEIYGKDEASTPTPP
jgi:hypothetical protein